MTVSVTRDPKCAKMRKYRPTEELGSSPVSFGPVFVVAAHLCLYIISQYMYNTKEKKNILMAQMTCFNASFGPVFVVAAYFVPLNIR